MASSPANGPELSTRDLTTIMRLVYEKSGITLHPGKRALVTARLQKRLRHWGFPTFKEYVRHLRADTSGEEITAMLDAIATNHTSFFREPQHFEFLSDLLVPLHRERRGGEPILGWSAACSTGEEAYTLAIVAFERLGEDARRIRLLASDLSTKALAAARAGVYKAERVAEMPRHLVLKYFTKGSGDQRGLVQVAEALRQMVDFRQLNLLDPPPPGPPLDFIFCRNAMIYFDRQTQQRVIERLEDRLAPGGYLFTSHSESLNSLRHNLTWIAPAIYRRGTP